MGSGTRPFSLSAPGTWQLIAAKMQRIHRLNSGLYCFRETDPEVRWLVASCGLISDNKEWPWPGRALLLLLGLPLLIPCQCWAVEELIEEW